MDEKTRAAIKTLIRALELRSAGDHYLSAAETEAVALLNAEAMRLTVSPEPVAYIATDDAGRQEAILACDVDFLDTRQMTPLVPAA